MAMKKIQKRLFGTNGVRGVVGKDLTPDLVLHIGETLGTLRGGRIAVGRDTRTSGESLLCALKAGLLATGCEVSDCGILPTPALQYIVREHHDGGAMVTASHNPPEYNGIKIIEADGTEMGDEETLKFEDTLFNGSLSVKPWNQTGKETNAHHLIDEYIHAIVRQFPEHPGNGMKVVVDPGSGPACRTTRDILTKLGCRVITINDVMDGTFPGRLPEPSPEGLKDLSRLVTSTGAALGIAHDGDADRAVFVDEKGCFVEENHELALVAQYICSHRKGIVVTPVSTSQIVEMVVQELGGEVKYTPVGSIYVARAMRLLITEGKTVVLGGEGNGGLIFPDHQFCRDGAMTAAMMVSILEATGEKLSTLITRLPERAMVKEKIAVSRPVHFLKILERIYKEYPIDTTDGLKIMMGSSWLLVRASGTEPLMRVIIDAESEEKAQEIYRGFLDSVSSSVGEINSVF